MKNLRDIVKRILKESEFDWVKDVSLEETLDDMFGIYMDNGIVKFRKASTVKDIAHVYDKLIMSSGEGLYRKLNQEGFKWYKMNDIILMFKSGNTIDKWRSSRIDNIEENYPRSHDYYMRNLLSWG